MSRQDGGTGFIWPQVIRPHHGRSIAAVARSLALMAALFLLPACTGPFGTAMSGLFGAGAMFAGQSALKRGEADVRAKDDWRKKKQDYVEEYADGMAFEAKIYQRAGKFEDWRRVMRQLIAFWDTQHPETLVMELRRRAKDVVPEPKLIERAVG